MIKLHDKIMSVPETGSSDVAVPAEVTYIHPAGRFYQVTYNLGKVVTHETRYFTAEELELGTQLGLFPDRLKAMNHAKSNTPKGMRDMEKYLDPDMSPQPSQSMSSDELADELASMF